MRSFLTTISLVILMATAGFFAPVRAADDADDHPASKDDRMLNDHWFIPSGRLPDPFVTTHVRSRVAAGFASRFKSPYIVISGDTLGQLGGDLAFFGLDIEYQQNLFHMASLRLSLEGNARAGTSGGTLLANGVTSLYGFELEGKARILRRSKMEITGVAGMSRKDAFDINLIRFAKGILDSGEAKTGELVEQNDIERFYAGPAVAYAVKPWLGFTGHAFFGSAQPFDRSSLDQFLFRGGIIGEVDFGKLSSVPVGLVIGYDMDSFPKPRIRASRVFRRGRSRSPTPVARTSAWGSRSRIRSSRSPVRRANSTRPSSTSTCGTTSDALTRYRPARAGLRARAAPHG
jgi:hypothetical protein